MLRVSSELVRTKSVNQNDVAITLIDRIKNILSLNFLEQEADPPSLDSRTFYPTQIFGSMWRSVQLFFGFGEAYYDTVRERRYQEHTDEVGSSDM
ncbi:hypothetical protein N9Y92_02130 [Chlamydiales bacterium]|nr:hypothetical protein [Chlamydiales bacterium]